jgi:hypothetical protein
MRYTLSLEGTVYASDGREERIENYISFFAVSRSGRPYVVQVIPSDGESASVGPLPALRIYFSLPMDRTSTADALVIDGVSEREIEWSDDDRLLIVHCKQQLSPWTTYNWTLAKTALSREGAPLAAEAGGCFITDEDDLEPEVEEVTPLLNAGGGLWLRTGLDMERGLGPAQGIGVRFNKAMDQDSLLGCVRFEPSIAGRSELWGEDAVVFIPNRDPEPETNYVLVIRAGVKDTTGLTTANEFRLNFVPGIPYLEVLSLESGGETIEMPQANGSYAVHLVPPEGLARLSLKFSRPFTTAQQAETIRTLSLEPFFPRSLKAAGLRTALWLSDDAIFLEWEGLEKTGSGASYYRLSLPGGRGGINDGGGSYLKETYYLYLEAVDG